MTRHLQAIVLHGKNDLRYEPDYPAPSPAPGEVLLRMTYSSICQTDIELWHRGMFFGSGEPRILGHEAAGVVEQLGEGVTGIEIGTRVAVENVRTCGTCFFCRKGTQQLCENGRNFGFSDNGGLAEFAVWPAALCIKLPENITNEEAPLSEPTSVAVHAVTQSGIQVGDTAAVIGCGVVGLLTLQVLQAAGAKVVAIDPREQSLALAKEFGAIETLNPAEVDVAKLLPQIADELRTGTYGSSLRREGVRGRVDGDAGPKSSDDARSLTKSGDQVVRRRPAQKTRPEPNAHGPDVVFDTAGAPGTALNSARWTRRGGKAIIVGFSGQDQTLNLGRTLMGEKTIMGSSATGTGEYQKAVDLIATGAVNVKPLISALVPLDRGIPDGFERMLKPEKDVYRILVGNG